MTSVKVRHKTAVLSAAVAVTLPLVLAACSGGGGSSGTSASGGSAKSITEIDYSTSEPNNTAVQTALNNCGKQVGVTISRQTVPGSSYSQKLLQLASSHTLPDLLMIDNPGVAQFAALGVLSPLSDYGLTASGFSPGPTQAGTYQGKLYGLAPSYNTIALFYNKKDLQQAHVAVPATWDQLMSAASALTTPSRYGVAFSGVATDESTWQFLPFLWSAGGNENNLNSSGTVQALDLWKKLVSDGSASKSVLQWAQEDVAAQFIAGKTAMMVMGNWEIPVLNKISGMQYGTAPIPAPTAGTTVQVPFGGELWTVPNTGRTASEQAAAKVLKCFTDPASQQYLATTQQLVPTRLALAPSYAAANPDLSVFISELKNSRSRTAELGPKWPTASQAIYTAIQSVITGQQSAQTAAATAASTVKNATGQS